MGKQVTEEEFKKLQKLCEKLEERIKTLEDKVRGLQSRHTLYK